MGVIRSSAAAIAVTMLLAFSAGAQQYPSKPIRLVVPFAPGGSSGIVARAFAAEMSKGLGQEIIIDNRPGGAGNIAMEAVAKAEPDGYTLILGHIGSLAMNPFMFAKLPFDTNRDFAPVSLFAKVPSILHTPLMSGSNAIHGVILVGSMLILGEANTSLEEILGFIAVILATLNVVGGFVVTDRMLEMFKAKPKGKPTTEESQS